MLNSRTIYFFDASGAVMEERTYHATDFYAVCRAAAEYADEIEASDYDFELPEAEEDTQEFLEAAE